MVSLLPTLWLYRALFYLRLHRYGTYKPDSLLAYCGTLNRYMETRVFAFYVIRILYGTPAEDDFTSTD
jgi:hypothetical protein